MGVSTGAKLGPYELMQSVGAGGMGEVYRARDTRLRRDVAIKILPASLVTNTQLLRRFEQEARAAAALNHPNILAVYDIGSEGGAPYIVSELLEGETLRARLRGGPLPVRRAIDYAQQIARALAAAHDRGIVHRDLKPENIFITQDGRVKVLDFGIAKLTRPEPPEDRTATAKFGEVSGTAPGTVIGTVGYMSPEQVRGQEVGPASDLFSFGVVLYEMLAGVRAFRGVSDADTMSAILKEDPPELTQTNAQVPTTLEHIVRHCLEKSPEERFHSAHDIAFDLQLISSASGATEPQIVPTVPPPAVKRRWVFGVLLGTAVIALAVLAGILIGRKAVGSSAVPVYQQMTFRRGTIRTGKFAPGGQVVYAAAWESNPPEVFTAVGGGARFNDGYPRCGRGVHLACRRSAAGYEPGIGRGVRPAGNSGARASFRRGAAAHDGRHTGRRLVPGWDCDRGGALCRAALSPERQGVYGCSTLARTAA